MRVHTMMPAHGRTGLNVPLPVAKRSNGASDAYGCRRYEERITEKTIAT